MRCLLAAIMSVFSILCLVPNACGRSSVRGLKHGSKEPLSGFEARTAWRGDLYDDYYAHAQLAPGLEPQQEEEDYLPVVREADPEWMYVPPSAAPASSTRKSSMAPEDNAVLAARALELLREEEQLRRMDDIRDRVDSLQDMLEEGLRREPAQGRGAAVLSKNGESVSTVVLEDKSNALVWVLLILFGVTLPLAVVACLLCTLWLSGRHSEGLPHLLDLFVKQAASRVQSSTEAQSPEPPILEPPPPPPPQPTTPVPPPPPPPPPPQPTTPVAPPRVTALQRSNVPPKPTPKALPTSKPLPSTASLSRETSRGRWQERDNFSETVVRNTKLRVMSSPSAVGGVSSDEDEDGREEVHIYTRSGVVDPFLDHLCPSTSSSSSSEHL